MPPPKKNDENKPVIYHNCLVAVVPPTAGAQRGGQGGTATKKEKLTFRLLRVCKGTVVNRQGDSPPRQPACDRREPTNRRATDSATKRV